MPYLINAAQLDKFRKNQKNVILLDASWHLPEDNRNAYEEFKAGHLPGARFFHLDDFHDADHPIPNMLTRDESLIAKKLGELGITGDQKIIFYDNSKLRTSCRALWMFKVFGYNPLQLYVLDNGMNAWHSYGGKLETGEPKPAAQKQFPVRYQAQLIRSLVQMKANLSESKEQIIDMRHPVRFCGGAEHRPGIRSGHIPGSISFPYITMFEIDGRMKPIDKIKRQLAGVGVDLSYPITSLCGSGVTACILDFVLDLLDQGQHTVYDGSWCEWGAETLYPSEASLAERPVATSLDS